MSDTFSTTPVDDTASAHPRYAQVAFNLPLKEAYTYEIPPEFRGAVEVGMRVLVPFGRRKLTGYVVALTDRADASLNLKCVEDVPDAKPVISPELLKLTHWIAEYYQCSWGEAIRTALPTGAEEASRELFSLTEEGRSALQARALSENLRRTLQALLDKPRLTLQQLRKALKNDFSAGTVARLRGKGLISGETRIKRNTVEYTYEKLVRVAASDRSREAIEKLLARSPRQREIYDILLESEKTIPELSALVASPSGPLKQLKDKKLVDAVTVKTARESRAENHAPASEKAPRFTSDQERVYQELRKAVENERFAAFLLHGVTGSGKTEIYIRCIEATLALGRQAVMMVPEISLTPQTANLFRKRFGDRVAILHSGLSDTERFLEWKRIFEGRVSIAVGARSAVFAPFKNPGLFIIDEEHDGSYKQDTAPRYHGRDTAIMRAKNLNAVAILGSATPSLESRRNAATGKYAYLSLPGRIHDRLMPLVCIADMRKERTQRKNFSMLSVDLKNALRVRIERKEQVFLFLNRRGTANYVFCKECGFVFYCGRCSVSLTFHESDSRLRCHYCNFTLRLPRACPECNGEVIRFQGYGTQKLEEEVRRAFPHARLLRLDRDTTRKHSDFEAMFEKMTCGEIDILIGTQMITKGHDFSNVTLVGVVQGDISLNIPDFRSAERTFQLLTQVAGRSGRGSIPGEVIVQTNNPEHYVYDFVCGHDYDNFYEKELQIRKKLNYPPFTRLVGLGIESESEERGQEFARKLKAILAAKLTRSKGVEILGPSRAALYRLNEKYRWHLILRSDDIWRAQSLTDRCSEIESLQKSAAGKVKLSIDVDPVNLL